MILFNCTDFFKQIYDNDAFNVSISNYSYKRILRNFKSPKIAKSWKTDKSNDTVEVYSNLPLAIDVIHITNEYLSTAIYNAIQQGKEFPEELSSVKFFTVEKNQEAVFAICKITPTVDFFITYAYTPNSILQKIVQLADDFSQILSTEDTKVYIDYSSLFNLCSSGHWVRAIFKSIVFEPITLTRTDVDSILEIILSHGDYNIGFNDLVTEIKESNETYFALLNKGIFPLAEKNRGNIPLGFEINVLRYVLNPPSIADIHDFFKYDDALLSLANNNYIVIDENRFVNSLSLTNENNDYIIYNSSEDYIFAKLKSPFSFEGFNDYIPSIDTHFLVSVNSGMYIFFKKDDNLKSLREIIRSIVGMDEKFLELIKNIAHWGKNNKDMQKVRFYNSTDFLDVFSLSELENEPVLTTPYAISLSDNDLGSPFNYMQVIMMAITEYMNHFDIEVDNIYSFDLIKVFHPSFTYALIQYIKSGTYKYPLTGEIFNGCSASQLEFVENLPLDDTKLLSKITLFDDYTPSPELANILKRHQQFKKKNGFLDLNSFLNSITSRKLNKGTASNIFLKPELPLDILMAPQKVIVSKDITINGSYKIIGVVWNHDCLYDFTKLINSKRLSCKQVYNIIYHLLRYANIHNYSYSHLGDIGTLLIDKHSLTPVFWVESLRYEPYITRYQIQLDDYCDRIITQIKTRTKFLEFYDFFSYRDFVPRNKDTWYKELLDFGNSLSSMSKCELHNNHWHIGNNLCPVCKKIFIVDNLYNYALNEVYKDDVSTFYTAGNYTLYVPNLCPDLLSIVNLEEVQLGIENNLFNKFAILRPTAIIKHPNNLRSPNIAFDSCNFSNIISLDTFKNIQRLKVILVMYKKLLPYILDGSFICTDIRIFETMVMHKDFKGELLIPNLPLMECRTILSDNTSVKKAKIEETKQRFADFLYKYIYSDNFLRDSAVEQNSQIAKIANDILQFNFSYNTIKKYLESHKKYCLIHMQPFATSESICPECLKNGIKVKDIDFYNRYYFESLASCAPINDGGEANIYKFTSNTKVQKIFKPHVDLAFKSRILAKAMEKNPLISKFNESHEDIKIISATKLLYMQEGYTIQLKGYVQDFIQDSYEISNLRDKDFVKEHGYTRIDIIEILIKVCKGIEFLHSIGGFIGDLNGGNILIKGKNVYIIDIDGMSFDDVKNCVYTNMYIYPPSAESKNITKEDDWYSLAVQAFYYLTYSHPFRGICNNKTVPENETERMKLGISVLGEHKIMPPSISIGWEFIPTYLLKYFLDTFEGTKRESMLEILETYLVYLKKYDSMFVEITRSRKVYRNLNEHTYIDSNSNLIYKEFCISNISGDVLVVSGCNNSLIALNRCAYLIDTKTDLRFKISGNYRDLPVISQYSNKIYYTSYDQRNIYVDSFDNKTGKSPTEHIAKKSTYKIVDLEAGKDLIFIEDNTDLNSYDIYYNCDKIYDVSKNNVGNNVNIQISYDELSKKWLILFKGSTKTTFVVIEGKNVSEFETSQLLSEHVCFYGNTLYYVGDGIIHFYNINTHTLKSIECVYAKPDSNIYRYGNKFVIMNKTKLYVCEKS